MSLFKKSKATIIPELENPKDKKLDKVMEYLDNELQDDPKDMEFPLPKPENIYLKINNNNYLEPIDKVYITDIYYKISKFRDENTNNFDIVLKTAKEIFDKMSDTYKNLFDYSLEMSKNLEVTKEHIEKCYKVLLSKKNATTLDFDAES